MQTRSYNTHISRYLMNCNAGMFVLHHNRCNELRHVRLVDKLLTGSGSNWEMTDKNQASLRKFRKTLHMAVCLLWNLLGMLCLLAEQSMFLFDFSVQFRNEHCSLQNYPIQNIPDMAFGCKVAIENLLLERHLNRCYLQVSKVGFWFVFHLHK
uniref:Uncharacterized protein n=1 Tax=Ciona intestinalis TaxID=7719 RepID=F6SJ71_CIOIN